MKCEFVLGSLDQDVLQVCSDILGLPTHFDKLRIFVRFEKDLDPVEYPQCVGDQEVKEGE